MRGDFLFGGIERSCATLAICASLLAAPAFAAAPGCPAPGFLANWEKQHTDRFIVRFGGDRPDEDLAAFYDFLAECEPAALRPVTASRPPLGPFEYTSGPMPVATSKFAAATFISAGQKLAGHLSANGPRTDFAAPDIEFVRRDAQQIVPLTRARFGKAANGTKVLAAPAPWPNAAQIEAACRRLGKGAECFSDNSISAVWDEATGLASSVHAFVSHFELVATLRLPREQGRALLASAIDAAVSSRLAPSQSRPTVHNLDDGVIPLSASAPATSLGLQPFYCELEAGSCKKAADHALIKEWTGKLERARKAVHWSPELVKYHPTSASTNIAVFDPGFAPLQGGGKPKLCSQKGGPTEIGENILNCLKAEGGFEGDTASWTHGPEVWIKSNGGAYGHGIHVGSLAAGKSKYSFGAEGDGPTVVFGEPYSSIDTMKAEKYQLQDVGGRITNRSYGENDSNSHNFHNQVDVLTPQYIVGAAISEAAQHRPDFSVIAAPWINDGTNKPSCAGVTSFTDPGVMGDGAAVDSAKLICLAHYAFGMGVVPATAPEASASDATLEGWRVMTEPPGVSGAKYALDIATGNFDFLWLAAPGDDMPGKDALMSGTHTVAIGFGARRGSSQAAAIVSSLAARVSAIQSTTLKAHQLKSWIFATSSLFPEYSVDPGLNQANQKLRASVVGMISFRRALQGFPFKANVWRCKNQQNQTCDFGTEEFAYDEMFVMNDKFVERLRLTIGVGARPIAIFRASDLPKNAAADAPALYVLADQNLQGCVHGVTVCRVLIKKKIDMDPSECALSFTPGQNNLPPCIQIADPTMSKLVAVNFAQASHAVALPTIDGKCAWMVKSGNEQARCYW